MKLLLASFVLATVAGCATQNVPQGMAAGKFVSFACKDGKTFSARASGDGASVRVRAHHGAAELDRKTAGVYEGEGYKLDGTGPQGFTLMHEGKPQGANCKVVS